MPNTEEKFNAARRRIGMARQKPELPPAYVRSRKPTVIAAEPAGLEWTVELWANDRLLHIIDARPVPTLRP